MTLRIGLSLLLACGAMATAAIGAETYPSKPIRMVVPFPPGAASDFLARTLGQKLNELYNQQVVIDNRPGAGGIVGSTLVAKSAPDGYTLGMVGQPHLMQPLLQRVPPYRALDDIACVIQVAALPNVLVVSPQLPVKSVSDVIALAKSKPGTLNFGSAGIGSSSHIAGEALKAAAGIDIVHVPFKLLPDIFAEMLAGRVQLYMFPLPAVMPMLKDSKLHVVAVGTPQPSPSLPGVPTMSESGLPGFQSQSWFGIVGPVALPRATVLQLNRDVAKILATNDIKERFLRQGAVPAYGAPEDFKQLMQADFARYQKLVKDAGISAQ
ncbi:MAG: Tricarboxylate transport protein TctC [Betaproteobacteria bacterium]|nr:Tricarboxylate transport protein TctC [Betaproteobacteria bacterium]